jgi:tight adherence protein B
MPGSVVGTALWALLASTVVDRPSTGRRLVQAFGPRNRSVTVTERTDRIRRVLLRLRPSRSAAPERTVDVAELADYLASLVRAGLPPGRAWHVLATTPGPAPGVCRSVTARLAAGGSVGEGLRAVEGPVGLSWLAMALESAERTGAPLAQVLDAFAHGLREDARAAAEREAALAGPRATRTVLSLLPAVGIGLGHLLGAAPVHTLLFTGAGRGCLISGLGLWLLGWWWFRILILRAERAGDVRVP